MKFTNSGPAIFSRCSSKPEFHAESRLTLCLRLGSELASRAGQKPIIVSPNSKEILLVSTIPLRAKADADVREIFWFAGKQFVGKAAQNQVLEWTATAGDYEVTALDDYGRAGSHIVVVR